MCVWVLINNHIENGKMFRFVKQHIYYSASIKAIPD